MAELTVTDSASINMGSLTDEQKAKVQDISSKIDFENTQAVMQFGAAIQSKVSSSADQIMDKVRSKDGGEATQLITDLLLKFKGIDVNSLSTKKSGIFKIFSSMVDATRKFIAQYEKICPQIEEIASQLDKENLKLLSNVSYLDKMYKDSTQVVSELSLYIVAGELKLKEIRETMIPELQQKAKESNDPIVTQELDDKVKMADRFEKKIYNLKLSREAALLSAPQVRLIQQNAQQISENIQEQILQTIPLWKNQIAIAITQMENKKGLELTSNVRKTTNDLLKANSAMLKQTSVEAAKENEKGIIEIETLQQVHADLISTLEETLKIHQEGKVQRQLAEQKMEEMEQQLKTKMLDLSQQQTN